MKYMILAATLWSMNALAGASTPCPYQQAGKGGLYAPSNPGARDNAARKAAALLGTKTPATAPQTYTRPINSAA